MSAPRTSHFLLSTMLGALALVATACREAPIGTGPEGLLASIVDGANGGSAGFYFLPPMVKQPVFTGTFDAGLSPVVEVCNDATCTSLHTSFSMTAGGGSETVRVDVTAEQYLVNWNSGKTGAVSGRQYRVRVLIDGAVAGYADVVFDSKVKGPKNAATGEPIVTADGSTLPIKFRVETGRGGGAPPLPTYAATCRSCLEVVPGAVILPGAGEQQLLRAFVVDAQGNRSPAAANFTSSHPDQVSVSAGGLATAVAAVGSSQITATLGAMTSAPVLALVATPVPGALLIGDHQIVGEITPVDPAAPETPGFKYHVHLKGVLPAVGQVVINTGFLPVGGKVVSVTPGADDNDVVLELLPLAGMFLTLDINQQIPLVHVPIQLATAAPAAMRVMPGASGGVQAQLLSSRLMPTHLRASAAAAGEEDDDGVKFNLGPFECEAKSAAGLDFPISLGTASFSLNPNLTLDLEVRNLSIKRAIATGTLAPVISFSPSLTASVEGSLECKAKIGQINPPIGGPIAYFFGIQIPFGVGFGLEAKGEVDGMGFEAFMSGNVTASFGFACLAACGLVSELSSNAGGFFKPSTPSLNLLRTEIGVSGFGWATIAVGVPFDADFQLEILEVKAGLAQKAELATTLAQALDPEYASGFALEGALEASNSTELSAAASFLSISLPELKLEEEIPISESPKGTLAISPSDPEPGDASNPGELTTFTVNLTSTNYLNLYAVDGVELRWLRTNDDGDEVLEPARPGCSAIMPASNGQTQFSCQALFLKEHEGPQKFYAFAHANLFGVSVPIPLELGDDSKATAEVISYGHVHRRVDFTVGTVQETDAMATEALVAVPGGGFAGPGIATYHSETTVTNPAGCQIRAVFNGSGSNLTIVSTSAVGWALRAFVSGTHDDTNSCTGFTTPFPFGFEVTLANGVGIIRNGVLKGIDFRQNFTSPTATFLGTGRLKVSTTP